MTVNKSQGQSLKTVVADLQTFAFTFGQLYVPLSRVKAHRGLQYYFRKMGMEKQILWCIQKYYSGHLKPKIE